MLICCYLKCIVFGDRTYQSLFLYRLGISILLSQGTMTVSPVPH